MCRVCDVIRSFENGASLQQFKCKYWRRYDFSLIGSKFFSLFCFQRVFSICMVLPWIWNACLSWSKQRKSFWRMECVHWAPTLNWKMPVSLQHRKKKVKEMMNFILKRLLLLKRLQIPSINWKVNGFDSYYWNFCGKKWWFFFDLFQCVILNCMDFNLTWIACFVWCPLKKFVTLMECSRLIWICLLCTQKKTMNYSFRNNCDWVILANESHEIQKKSIQMY